MRGAGARRAPEAAGRARQTMFGALALSNQDHFRPEGFWRAFKDYDGEPINVREHQDAYEFFTRLQARAPRRPALVAASGGRVLCPRYQEFAPCEGCGGKPINVREHWDAYEFCTRLQARARAHRGRRQGRGMRPVRAATAIPAPYISAGTPESSPRGCRRALASKPTGLGPAASLYAP
jgi:hypothetical protein